MKLTEKEDMCYKLIGFLFDRDRRAFVYRLKMNPAVVIAEEIVHEMVQEAIQ